MSGGRAKQKPKRIVADKAYNSKMIRNWCWCHSIMVTIPKKKNEKYQVKIDPSV
jgi:hypothetical protein